MKTLTCGVDHRMRKTTDQRAEIHATNPHDDAVVAVEENKATSESATWRSTNTQHLIQHVPSGRYYIRMKVRGKIVRQSLGTTSLTVAKTRLPERIREIRYCNDAPPTDNLVTMGDCLDMVRDAAKHKTGLREKSRAYRDFTVGRVVASWPGITELKPKEITPRDCERWFNGVAEKYSPSLANNMLGTLRMAVSFARKAGLIFRDPTEEVKRASMTAKKLTLPSPEQFRQFVAAIRENRNAVKKSWHSEAAADFVEFLAYSGARRDEAAHVRWGDIDMGRKMIFLCRTKGGRPRWVPIIPAMEDLLKRLPRKGDFVLRVCEAEKSMTLSAVTQSAPPSVT
jgi:integrase